MTYLLAKYTLLFLLTALLSFILGYWWSRRNFVDVSESFEELRRAKSPDEALWQTLWDRLDGMKGSIAPTIRSELTQIPQPDFPKLDLSGVEHRLGVIENKFADIPEPKDPDFTDIIGHFGSLKTAIGGIPKPDQVDLSGIESQLSQLDQRVRDLPEPPQPERVDLSPVTDRVAALEGIIRDLPAPVKPEPVNLQPISDRIHGLEQLLKNMPKPEKPEVVDLTPVHNKFQKLESMIANLPVPEKPERLDLSPLNNRVQKLETMIANLPRPEKPAVVDLIPLNNKVSQIDQLVRNLPKPEPQKTVSLQPVEQRLTRVEEALKAIPTVETKSVDLTPLTNRLTDLDRTVRNLKPESIDLAPLQSRLTSIEQEIKSLQSRISQQKTVIREVRKEAVKHEGPRLLRTASHGQKDDLKRISGVGPKLERLLNRNGVYYFWQVASWTKKDIEFVDDRLEVFKGRISRDNWVSQAKHLKKSPGAATEPS